MAKKFTSLDPTAKVGMSSIYRMSDAPPNWSQNDPTQPDYIANKDLAEKLRPIYVNGVQVLDDTHESGLLDLVGGSGISIVVEGNRVIFNSTGSEGSGDFNYLPGDGITISDVVAGYKTINIDELYLTEKVIIPKLEPMLEVLQQQHDTLAILIDNDEGKSAREIAIEVSQSEIPKWFADNSKEETILEQLSALKAIVDIKEPISGFVNKAVDSRVEELGGGSSTPATSDKLGVVKIDGKTIKMNSNDQIYISEISTDNLVQGEYTLVLNGGND